MREIVPSNRLVTQMAPSPAAMSVGPFPTDRFPHHRVRLGLIRETDLSPLFTTHGVEPGDPGRVLST